MPSDELGNVAFVFRFARAVRESDLASSTKLVLFVLASYADASGANAFPGERRIAADASLSRSTVQAHLRAAVAAGFLKRAGKKGRSNCFRLAIPDIPKRQITGPMTGPLVETNGPTIGPNSGMTGPIIGPELDRPSVHTSPMTSPSYSRAHAQSEPGGFQAIVQAMTAAGVTHCLSDRGQRLIRQWVQQGVSLSVCGEAIGRARRSKPNDPIPVGYLRPIVHELTTNQRQTNGGNSRRHSESHVASFWRNAAASQ